MSTVFELTLNLENNKLREALKKDFEQATRKEKQRFVYSMTMHSIRA